MWRRRSRLWPTRGWYSVLEFGRVADLSPWTKCEVPTELFACCLFLGTVERSVREPLGLSSQYSAVPKLCNTTHAVCSVVAACWEQSRWFSGRNRRPATCWRLDGADESLDLLRQFHESTRLQKVWSETQYRYASLNDADTFWEMRR